MDLYSKNLNYFKSVAGLIYKTITEEKSSYDSKAEYLEEYENIWVENNDTRCFIHSIYNREREIEEFLKGIEEETEFLIIYGFGLCISAEMIKKRFPKIEHIVFLEPDLNIFKQTLKIVDIENTLNLFYGRDVTYVVNKTPEEACGIIFSMLQNRVNKKFSFIYNVSYRALYKNYFEAFTETFIKNIKRLRLNITTQAELVYDEVKNIFINISEESIPVENFMDKFKDIPAIIVAGGPSLNKNMEYLRGLKDKALIIAAGNGIKILHENGITPHFRMAYDPNELEYKIFENIDTEAAPLIYTDRLYYECVKNYKGKKVKFFSSVELFSQHIEKKIKSDYLVLESGFTIVALVLDMLIKLGVKKIIFTGQDLSYTEEGMYAKGSIYDNVETIDFEKHGFIKMKDINGNTAYTEDGFLGMKYNLEDRIKMYPQNTYINATEGGLNIEGTIIKTLKQVIDEDLTKDFNIEEIISSEFSKKKDIEERNDKLREAVKEFLDELDEVDRLNNERINYIEKIVKNRNKGYKLNRILNDINYLNKENALEKNPLYMNVINPTIANVLYSIYWTFTYSGEDKEKKAQSDLRLHFNLSCEIRKVIEIIKNIVGQSLDL